MVSIVSRLKGGMKQALDDTFGNNTLKLMTPLDTYESVYQHSIQYPGLKDYLWKIEMPTLSTTSYKGVMNVSSPNDSFSLGDSPLGPIVSTITGNLINAAANMAVNSLYHSTATGSDAYPENFSPRVIQASLPLPGFDVTSAIYQGWRYTFPKSETLNPFSVDLWVDEQGYALAYYLLWHNKAKNRDGTVNYPGEYERDIPIALYKRNSDLSIRFTAYGCYPTSCTSISLNDGSGQGLVKSIRVSFALREIGLNSINGHSSPLNKTTTKLYNRVQELL